MSLIKCSECGKDISDKAEACPHCGNPLLHAVVAENFLEEKPAVTVQRTFKKWKAIKLVSWLLIILGLLMLSHGVEGQALGSAGILFGVIGLTIAKLGAWWTTG